MTNLRVYYISFCEILYTLTSYNKYNPLNTQPNNINPQNMFYSCCTLGFKWKLYARFYVFFQFSNVKILLTYT